MYNLNKQLFVELALKHKMLANKSHIGKFLS